jgi:hypothetical protein
MSYVQVMVPESELAAVYRLLAASASEGFGDNAEQSNSAWADPAYVTQHLKPRSETVRAFAKYLAGRPGEEVSSDEAAAVLDLEHGWNSLAGALGALGNYFSNRDITFPWDYSWDPEDGRTRFTMGEDVAKAINEVL